MPSKIYPDSRPAYRYPWYIQPKVIPGMRNFDDSRYAEGFDGNGDYVYLPYGTSNITYYNSAGVSQWSIAHTDVNADCDAWGGIMYDLTDDLIYMIAVDAGTTPDTFYLCSVNKAGTLTNIGNDQPATDFSGVINTGYQDINIYRDGGDGVGNLFLRAGVGNGEQMEINISTGAIVGDVDDIHTLGSVCRGNNCYLYKTPNGTYISTFNGNTTNNLISLHLLASTAGRVASTIHLPVNCGLGWASSMTPIMWKGYILTALLGVATNVNMGSHAYETAEWNEAFDTLARQNGLIE